MVILLAFILGIVFFNFIIPLLGFISDALEARVNVYITKCGIKTAENQVDIKKISNELDCHSVAAIGFQVDSEEDYYDDFDDVYKSEIRKIGF